MGEDARTFWSSAAVRLVSTTFPFDSDDDPSQWPLCARLMPHVALLDAHGPYSSAVDIALGRMLNQACCYFAARGDRQGALALAARAVDLGRTTLANSPLLLAGRLGNLGGRYVDLDRLDEAEKTFREALAIKEPRLRQDDPSLAVTLSNLAQVYWKRKEYAKVEPLYLRAADIMKTAYGAQSAQYGITLSNLGVLYDVWADVPDQAARRAQQQEYMTKEFAICLAVRGPRHPETATSYYNLAWTKVNAGGWRGAVEDMGRAVAIMLSLDLAEHPNTKQCARGLCGCWDQSGQGDKAARLLKGDISDLLPVIKQIEAEHRAWVAKDPKNRQFGPASPFDP